MAQKIDKKNRANEVMRQSNSLLNEHWKRKQRLKSDAPLLDPERTISPPTGALLEGSSAAGLRSEMATFSRPATGSVDAVTDHKAAPEVQELNCGSIRPGASNANFVTTCWPPPAGHRSHHRGRRSARPLLAHPANGVSDLNHHDADRRRALPTRLTTFTGVGRLLAALSLASLALVWLVGAARAQSLLQSDPRPTIYSGQVSFGLLLSAHSSLGAELSTSASHRVVSLLRVEPPENFTSPESAAAAAATSPATTTQTNTPKSAKQEPTMGPNSAPSSPSPSNQTGGSELLLLEPQFQLLSDTLLEELVEGQESRLEAHHSLDKRQIFERTGQHRRQQQLQSVQLTGVASHKTGHQQQPGGGQSAAPAQAATHDSGICSQVNANALYAGMGAIWASHQANLVGDSHLAIGTYVYDSCNDLDVGQRQSVRIVSNLNAFQQTTCESPRGSPISLTIAHGDNQLRAIQLLTSFRVPVITTKEHFALEDYNQLTRDQKRFLFTTAPSSRHLAVGALRFSKRIVSRSVSSPKLPNQFYKMSSKNGLIVISRNLPARFIAYLTEMIPNHVNYEMLQSSQPIDQIRSVEALESILIRSSAGSAAESKLAPVQAAPTSGAAAKKPAGEGRARQRRNDDSSADGLSSDFDSSAGSDEPDGASRMLSPTILMFITPSEAIDLVTRLRNDLAEVSRYYSLIVSTREDISPALKTIFHRGGSRLCSGKAFYTISPKPDDIGEFSRYFRDTVQMEGESSDHPLVCEFAKYQASSRVSADLDDISTEPVIKAVWAAAAAFKSVHRRECASLASGAAGAGGSSAASPLAAAANSIAGGGGAELTSGATQSGPGGQSRTMSSRQSSKTAHAECLVKMNKNMSNLVQRALKRLDVTINSTGLQSLDGFRLKFDDLNELMTNKFSIKYINKECEITEIGQYSGHKDSSLRIDEEHLVKSLEGSMPDPWPVHAKPPAPPTAAPTTTDRPSSTKEGGSSSGDSSAGDTTTGGGGDPSDNTPAASSKSRRKGKRGGSAPAVDSDDSGKAGEQEEDTTPTIAGESAEAGPSANEQPKRNRKRSKPSGGGDEKLAAKPRKDSTGKKKLVAAPVTALGGKNILPGVTDTEVPTGDSRGSRAAASSVSSASTSSMAQQPSTTSGPLVPSSQKPMRKLKPFPSPAGTTFKDWLPLGEALTTANSRLDYQTTTRTPKYTQTESAVNEASTRALDAKRKGQSDDYLDELLARPTTQAPIQTTLPESDGNADLEPPIRHNNTSRTRSLPAGAPKLGRALQASASTTRESTDYVTAPSISTNLYNQQPSLTRQPYPLPSSVHHLHHQHHYPSHQSQVQMEQPLRSPLNFSAADGDLPIVDDRNNDYLKDLNASPIPLSATAHREDLPLTTDESSSSEPKGGRYRLRTTNRSHLRWIYSSWYALSILGANIVGALSTLYVLTFLLMRNCDGSLDRDNQGIRSMHLLAIIVVFFGSTLFIVYPTPGLCLLRTSWHNFALVMLFGSLLLQAMQIRSLNSLGLGGRPNRLNQFLTLVFMVGVQVAFELQRWKYESANYMNFVNQYFGGLANGQERKFVALNGAISSDHFNPLNSFNDQVTPVNIQISEHYHSLLQDYCLQQADDFLQGQAYLCLLVGLLVAFSASNRRKRRLTGAHATKHKLKSHLTSGKLVASQHEANLSLSPSHFQPFASAAAAVGGSSSAASGQTGNLFLVTLVSALVYSISVVLHLYGQNAANRDLISSLAMVLIAFTALLGIFLPILLQIHRYDSALLSANNSTSGASSSSHLTGSLSRPTLGGAVTGQQSGVGGGKLQDPATGQLSPCSPPSTAFTMFPEFAPTGLRRPASLSGESSSGAGSRRTFAETKESRRNMGAALANLGPSADSLRSMGFYTAEKAQKQQQQQAETSKGLTAADPALLNLKLNLSAMDEPSLAAVAENDDYDTGDSLHYHHQHHHHHRCHSHLEHGHHRQQQQQQVSSSSSSSSRKQSKKGEKRLIMLDVDPCCPRHGLGARPAKTSGCNNFSPPKIN